MSRLAPVLAALLCAACGRDEVAAATTDEPGWSLLARAPDSSLRQAGELVPDAERQWGEHGGFGWEGYLGKSNGRSFVWSRSKHARLILPAGAKRERVLEIEMLVPPAGAGRPSAQEVDVRLNDVSVGTATVDTALTTVRIETPAAVWRAGDNVLELAVDHLRRMPEPERIYGVGVARVAYDVPAQPEWDPERATLVLPSDTGARYRVEEVGPLDLAIRGAADGAGRAELTIARVDPATGRPAEELAATRIALDDERLDRRIALPATGGDVLEIAIAWQAEDGARLALDRLRVIEREPRPTFPIVLLAIDTLAARRMSVYGYERDTTPRLAELARDAVVFDHCVTNAPWTLPSFMATMTGLYPEAHEVVTDAAARKLWEKWYLTDNRWTLAEALRARGYRTAGIVDNLWLTERFHFTQGFDHYDASAGEIPHADPDGGIRIVARRALDHLATDSGGRPDFLFLHCFDVHGPYKAEAPWRGAFEPTPDDAPEDDLRPAGGTMNAYGIVPDYITSVEFGGPAPEQVAASRVTARYDEGLLMTDHAVGELFDELKRRGLYEQALIVVFADHGETGGDGDYLYGHGVLDEEVLHVPLIVKLPGNASAGLRVPQTVQLVDLYPTIAELAGLPPRAGVHGRSLVPALRGETLAPAPALTVGGITRQGAISLEGWKLTVQQPGEYSAEAVLLTHPALRGSALPEAFPEALARPMTDAFLADLKRLEAFPAAIQHLRAIGSTPVIALFRPAEDPDEQRDLSQESPAVVAHLLGLLSREIARQEEAKALAEPPATPPHLSEADEAELRKLGYVDDSTE